ncbi:acetylxylan esterase [Kitasatospora sp. KL5]|uniref:acetylxylan esterase n=1 Tax=Kitasatospora sp. KL5 TaxID=3425125 RepID=UPI003D6FF302
MPLTDMPYEELLRYRPEVAGPEGLEVFWEGTLAAARAVGGGSAVTPVEGCLLRSAEVYDVRFPGFGGEPVAGWLLVPRGARGPLPAVVEYLGYSQGRGLPLERLLYVSAGYAYLVMDTRGQGHDTPDPHPGGPQWAAGFMTRGIGSPEDYYYRRLYTDAVRAVDFVRGLPQVDPARVVVAGASQGGGLALAAAALAGDAVAAALVDVPFLQHFPRAVETASAGPYPEIAEYLGLHRRDAVEQVFATLAYVDGLHLAPWASAPALFSAALMDPVCPPSTVFAAYHRYGGPADMEVWRFGDHAGGRASQQQRQLEWLHERGLGPEK